ncbi:MAG TPA: TadE family protein [Marmoricola sp.]|jgi:Flp pilus assembly protein TadG|nr:TadE family protein [Marmoricola sp.]
MRSPLRRYERRGEAGATALEYALVVPILFTVMFGIIQYGLYFWSTSTAAASAREAARQLSVGTDWGCTRAQALAKASGAAFGGTPLVSRTYLNASNTAKVGAHVRVTVSMKAFDLQLIPLPGDGAITESVEARVANLPPAPLDCA